MLLPELAKFPQCQTIAEAFPWCSEEEVAYINHGLTYLISKINKPYGQPVRPTQKPAVELFCYFDDLDCLPAEERKTPVLHELEVFLSLCNELEPDSVPKQAKIETRPQQFEEWKDHLDLDDVTLSRLDSVTRAIQSNDLKSASENNTNNNFLVEPDSAPESLVETEDLPVAHPSECVKVESHQYPTCIEKNEESTVFDVPSAPSEVKTRVADPPSDAGFQTQAAPQTSGVEASVRTKRPIHQKFEGKRFERKKEKKKKISPQPLIFIGLRLALPFYGRSQLTTNRDATSGVEKGSSYSPGSQSLSTSVE